MQNESVAEPATESRDPSHPHPTIEVVSSSIRLPVGAEIRRVKHEAPSDLLQPLIHSLTEAKHHRIARLLEELEAKPDSFKDRAVKLLQSLSFALDIDPVRRLRVGNAVYTIAIFEQVGDKLRGRLYSFIEPKTEAVLKDLLADVGANVTYSDSFVRPSGV